MLTNNNVYVSYSVKWNSEKLWILIILIVMCTLREQWKMKKWMRNAKCRFKLWSNGIQIPNNSMKIEYDINIVDWIVEFWSLRACLLIVWLNWLLKWFLQYCEFKGVVGWLNLLNWNALLHNGNNTFLLILLHI